MTELLSNLFIGRNADPKEPKTRQKFGTLSSFVGIGVNLLLSLAKLLIGIFSASMAITADALNNLSDAGSSLVSYITFRIAAKPADKDHPFGHARIEYIASMIVSFLILLVGAELFFGSFKAIIGTETAETPDFTAVTIIVLSLSILMKLWLGFFYRKIGKKIDSSVILASSADSFTDVISTAAVLVSTILIFIFDLAIIDAIVGLIVSVLILIAGIKILKENMNSILGEAPIEETVSELKKIIAEFPEIVGTHDLMVHNYGPNHYIASLHAEVNGEKDIYELHDMIDNAEKKIYNDLGILCTIHMDPIVVGNETVDKLREMVEGIVAEIAPEVHIHDFRAVIGQTHTNVIFDAELPFGHALEPGELKEKISENVRKIRADVFCVITVDRI